MAVGRMYRFTAIGLLSTLAACGGDSGLRNLRDYELSERQAQCFDRKPTAPGSVQACKNIARECERRREELGLYICRIH